MTKQEQRESLILAFEEWMRGEFWEEPHRDQSSVYCQLAGLTDEEVGNWLESVNQGYLPGLHWLDGGGFRICVTAWW